MKVLFLDIDGVLLSGLALRAGSDSRRLPREAISLLNDVCRRTGAFVVISSTWRLEADCRERLVQAGFSGSFHPDWRTTLHHTRRTETSLYIACSRGDEIGFWLEEHPEVTRYAIIDDDSDIRPEHLACFIKTEFMTGFEPSHAEALVAILTSDAGQSSSGRE